jgi:hypothetical protein
VKIIIMQDPTEEAEASIPTENVRDDPDLNQSRTFTVRRKAAKRTFPWDLAAGEINLGSPPPQVEDIQMTQVPRLEVPVMKKRRLKEPFSASTDEGAKHFSSHDTGESLLVTAAAATSFTAAAAAADDDHADADLVRGNRARDRKKKYSKDYRTDWAAVEDAVQTHGSNNWGAIAELVPGQTREQRYSREQSWARQHTAVDSRVVHTPSHTGHWTTDEDNKLEYVVQMHSGKKWGATAALISGRTQLQCYNRWHDVVGPSIAQAPARTGKGAADEVIKLKGAIQTHGDKELDTAVEGTRATGHRTPEEDATLNSEGTSARKKKYSKEDRTDWTAVEDAVQTQGCNDRGEIAELVPHHVRKGKWTTTEDCNLTAAVQAYGGKNWAAIATLVPGRTKSQCYNRWYVDPSIDQTPTRHTDKWGEDEVIKLVGAIHMHGDKDWAAISALVPGRMERECYERWQEILDPSIGHTPPRAGLWWTTEEDNKLKYAMHTHGDKNWFAISALVPGRTKNQCWHRWSRRKNDTDFNRSIV